jgi:hypothetical protein
VYLATGANSRLRSPENHHLISVKLTVGYLVKERAMDAITILFIGCALFGAMIGVAAAQRRGFSVAGGFLGGLMLGLLSPLLYLVDAEKQRCAHCMEWIHKAAKVCPKCQRSVGVQ